MNKANPDLGQVTMLGAHIPDVLGRPVEAIPSGQHSVRLSEIRATAAGTAAGTGVDLAKLGASVYAVGALGDDLLADMVTAAMRKHAVDTGGLIRKQGAQTSATILPIRPNGDRPALHVPGATPLLGLRDIDLEPIRNSRALLIGAPDALAGMTGEDLARIKARTTRTTRTTRANRPPRPRGRRGGHHRLRRPGRHRPGLGRRDRELRPGARLPGRRAAGRGRPDQGAHDMTNDQQLRQRAKAVIPGGMYGHQSAGPLPDAYPQFMRGGRGARVWDADGHEYVDLMCSYGPVVLGHQHPAVEAAAARQAKMGDCQNGPAPVMVDLAELLVATVKHADWAMFARNGTDATTMCCTIARAQTGRRKILVAKGAYHGAAPWCTPKPAGTTAADRANLGHYTFNDLASAQKAAEAAGDDLAGILVSPFKHDAGYDQELVDPAFARGLRALCDQHGAALILDDVRCGFRLHLGSSWEPVGVDPDLSAWSKAIANGRALAAVLGRDAFRGGASDIFVTGSFWFSAVPMAAAVATVNALKEEHAVEAMHRYGTQLRDGIVDQARSWDLAVRYTGPPVMPYLTFAGDRDHELASVFAAQALRGGAYLHPRHNWFVSAAMTGDDLALVLDATDQAFAAVRKHLGQ